LTRREALLALLIAFALVASGLTWLTGGWGLLISGVLLAFGVTFGVTVIPEEQRGEVVEPPAQRHARGVSL
jgi:hypothetical protein